MKKETKHLLLRPVSTRALALVRGGLDQPSFGVDKNCTVIYPDDTEQNCDLLVVKLPTSSRLLVDTTQKIA